MVRKIKKNLKKTFNIIVKYNTQKEKKILNKNQDLFKTIAITIKSTKLKHLLVTI